MGDADILIARGNPSGPLRSVDRFSYLQFLALKVSSHLYAQNTNFSFTFGYPMKLLFQK